MRIVLLPLAVAACLHARALADDSSQTPQRLDATVKVEMNYLLALPKDYGNKEPIASQHRRQRPFRLARDHRFRVP